MKCERGAMQTDVCEKATWTAPVLKKGAVGSETALTLSLVSDDGIVYS